MPLHKFKDPFHKIKETLSKYLPSSSKPPTAPSSTGSLFVDLLMRPAPSASPNATTSNDFGRPSSGKMFPKELSADLALFNNIFAQLHMKCRACHAPLILDIAAHLSTWLAGTQVIRPTAQASALLCPKCDQSTCVGCGGAPKLNKQDLFTTLGVVCTHCSISHAAVSQYLHQQC